MPPLHASVYSVKTASGVCRQISCANRRLKGLSEVIDEFRMGKTCKDL